MQVEPRLGMKDSNSTLNISGMFGLKQPYVQRRNKEKEK